MLTSYLGLIPTNSFPIIDSTTTSSRGRRRTYVVQIPDVWNLTNDSYKRSLVKKLALVCLAACTLSVIRLAYRVVAICCGDFLFVGHTKATDLWMQKRLKWAEENCSKSAASGGRASVIGNRVFYQEWAKASLIELIKNVVKVVTYPLAIVGLILSSGYGALINPLDGRIVVAKIEEMWSRDGMYVSKKNKIMCALSLVNLQLGDYLAFCMQPQRVWTHHDFYAKEDVFEGEEPFNLSNGDYNAQDVAKEIDRLLTRWIFDKNENFLYVKEWIAELRADKFAGWMRDEKFNTEILQLFTTLKRIEQESVTWIQEVEQGSREYLLTKIDSLDDAVNKMYLSLGDRCDELEKIADEAEEAAEA
ncbi:MAG: hypothetical protein H0X51_08515 [Parachlamydiaceae bacterium]|nr:hypothetical protein [Parachlamydiaceae bacterium]